PKLSGGTEDPDRSSARTRRAPSGVSIARYGRHGHSDRTSTSGSALNALWGESNGTAPASRIG
ncbi:MAG: hypothetical protein AB7I13_11315, partial [Vicinamibacterales bacterium]